MFSAPMLAFDVESSGVHMGHDYPISISVARSDEGGYVVPINDTILRPLLANPDIIKLAFNAKFDRGMMKKAGTIVDNLCDPMVAGHLLELPYQNLVYMVNHYLNGQTVPKFTDLDRSLLGMTLDEVADYSGSHSAILFTLWNAIEQQLKKYSLTKVFWDIEMPVLPVLSDMEYDGVAIDTAVLEQLRTYFNDKLSILQEALDFYSPKKGVNYNSSEQISDLFYKEIGITPDWVVGESGRPSVRKEHLIEVKHESPIIPIYLLYKKFITLRNNFVNGLLRRMYFGRVYGSFNQTRTGTGRLSASDPNLQNIPQRSEDGRKIRTAFKASEGCSLVKADADQIELRMLGNCSGARSLIDAFNSGVDIHTQTALRIYGDAKRRPDGKTRNFQTVYGGGDEKQKREWFAAYPGVKEWLDSAARECYDKGCARTIFGRRRTIYEYQKSDEIWREQGYYSRQVAKYREHGDRQSISTIVQGSSAEIFKIGMRKCWDVLRDSIIKFVLQVHDEFVLEVPKKYVPEVAEVMQRTMNYRELPIPVTMSIGVGDNWGSMRDWDVSKGTFAEKKSK